MNVCSAGGQDAKIKMREIGLANYADNWPHYGGTSAKHGSSDWCRSPHPSANGPCAGIWASWPLFCETQPAEFLQDLALVLSMMLLV